MNSVEDLIEIAQQLQDKGEIEPALETFSKAFDVLIDDAGKFAKGKFPHVTDLAVLRTMTPELFAYSTEYLKQDITAAYILNAMGVLFAEMKDFENAHLRFTEAMTYIPDGTDFSDPTDNLERLAGDILAAREAAQAAEESSIDNEEM